MIAHSTMTSKVIGISILPVPLQQTFNNQFCDNECGLVCLHCIWTGTLTITQDFSKMLTLAWVVDSQTPSNWTHKFACRSLFHCKLVMAHCWKLCRIYGSVVRSSSEYWGKYLLQHDVSVGYFSIRTYSRYVHEHGQCLIPL